MPALLASASVLSYSFLAILKKNSNKDNLSLLKQMMYLTFFIGVIGIVAWVIVQPHTPANGDSGKKQDIQQTSSEPAPAVAKAAAPEIIISPEEEARSPETASGACKDFGNWSRVCSKPKPPGWTIVSQHFDLIGDRAGCAYAICEPEGPATDAQVCYHFRTQGHDEQCGHSGNTRIQYSTGVLNVVWKHPAP